MFAISLVTVDRF